MEREREMRDEGARKAPKEIIGVDGWIGGRKAVRAGEKSRW